MTHGETPLFPLKTVLFPGGVLPLRIFEPRYLDMVSRCVRNGEPFGVLMIVSGGEVGGASTVDVGTLAEIVDWHRGADGLLGIVAVGRSRFVLEEARQLEDGLYVGRIAVLDPEPRCELPEAYGSLASLLREVLPTLGDAARYLTEDYGDATWVGYRLAEVLPLTLADRQACLEMNDPVARLKRLGTAVN